MRFVSRVKDYTFQGDNVVVHKSGHPPLIPTYLLVFGRSRTRVCLLSPTKATTRRVIGHQRWTYYPSSSAVDKGSGKKMASQDTQKDIHTGGQGQPRKSASHYLGGED